MTSGLNIADLSVRRAGKLVVDHVDLQVAPAAVTALLGPNGAGKSSMVLALAGVLPCQSATISVDGVAVRTGRPDRVRRSGIAVVPEGHRVLRDLSVADNLEVARTAMLRGSRGEDPVRRVVELFPELEPLLPRPAGLLSGGQQQMLAIAQALLTRPRYLVVDELSLGLAPVVVRRLAAALREVAEDGTGVLLIEQFTAVALSIAQTAYVLSHGRVRFTGSPAELESNPEVLQDAYLAGAPAPGNFNQPASK